jgi:hypothetical protein
MMGTNYIPAKDNEFDVWFKNLYEYVELKTGGMKPEWTHIPGGEVSGLNDARAAWSAVYEPTLKPHTPVR